MVVLYVEDVPAQAEVVETFLELADGEHTLCHAESLKTTRKLLKTESYDIILLDLGLPDCEGLELVDEVVALVPDTPIVVLTGSESAGLGVACLQAGAQDFLNKRELTPQKLIESLLYAITRKNDATPLLGRILARVKALHTGDIGEIDDKLLQRYQDILTQPRLLFTVEHWTLSQALARAGASSDQVLALHAQCLKKICSQGDANLKARLLSNSELVALATVSFMSDTYREMNGGQ